VVKESDARPNCERGAKIGTVGSMDGVSANRRMDGWMDGTKKKRGARRSAAATRDSGAVANA